MAFNAESFERASRSKLRVETPRGFVTMEDLWDLPLTSRSGFSLDDVAKALNRELKAQAEESFVNTTTSKARTEYQLAFDIALHIIEVRKAEREEAEARVERAQKKQKLRELIERKKDEQLSAASIEELEEAFAAL